MNSETDLSPNIKPDQSVQSSKLEAKNDSTRLESIQLYGELSNSCTNYNRRSVRKALTLLAAEFNVRVIPLGVSLEQKQKVVKEPRRSKTTKTNKIRNRDKTPMNPWSKEHDFIPLKISLSKAIAEVREEKVRLGLKSGILPDNNPKIINLRHSIEAKKTYIDSFLLKQEHKTN
jgi:hypothetical protein